MSSKAQELVVCKNFKLIRKLGTGAFGEIYLAENRSNPSEKYAAKLEETSSKFPQLYYQAKMYKYLGSFGPVVGIPKVHAITTEGQYNVMLMDLLGSSLEDLFVEAGKRLSIKTVLQVGEQMLDRIEFLHQKNILHRDIKPDNFLMGVGKQAHVVYLVDFGLSKKFIQENKHIPYKQGKELTGTARYASISTHMGIEQSRRDDIQSIGYVLMYLLRGILPWQNMKAKDTKTKYKLIMEKKIATPAEVLCKGFPMELGILINYAKGLKFQQKPDYKYLKGLLVTARKTYKIQNDYVYDWSTKLNTTSISLQIPKKEQYLEKKQKQQHVKHQKQDAINQAVNNFNVTGGSVTKNGQNHKYSQRQVIKDNKSSNKNTQGTIKNPKTLLGSVGLETLVTTKLMAPKISVVRR